METPFTRGGLALAEAMGLRLGGMLRLLIEYKEKNAIENDFEE